MPQSFPNFSISRIGEYQFDSPLSAVRFIGDDERVLLNARLRDLNSRTQPLEDLPMMEVAGPRERIYFDPSRLSCGIVTCGGLCPGLNDVIRSIVMSLHHHYGVTSIFGFRFGYEGLVPQCGHEPIRLSPESVHRINEFGGTILGSSRGPQDTSVMVRTLVDMNIGILFAIGGDGTLRGAHAIANEAAKQGEKISVIGIPKTIDNDISYVQKTFGFETAVAEAQRAIYAANSEAESAQNGIGLVKLMGRDSGFVAAYSALASSHVNFCLVPEVPFSLEALLCEIRERLESRHHALIVVAEGAGQELMETAGDRDASGNIKYGDIGVFLRDSIKDKFKKCGLEVNIKYIDPSYTIRSMPANPHDSAFCLLLGHNAVHAGMSGRTNMLVSFWNHQFAHVPISLAVSQRKKIDVKETLWSSVLACTGQASTMTGDRLLAHAH